MNHGLTVSSFNFRQVEIPLELVGMTPKDLFDLFDIAVKWGEFIDNGCMIGSAFADSKGKMLIAAHLTELRHGKNGIFICREDPKISCLFMPSAGFIFFKTLSGVILMWDKNISLAEARNAVMAIDTHAKKRGVVTSSGDRISR